MKKTMFSIILSFFAVIVCAFAFGSEDLTASALNDFSVTVEELTAADSSYTQAGDFKVTVSMANTLSSTASAAFGLYYDATNFEPVMKTTNDRPYYDLGDAASDSYAMVELDARLYGCVFLNYSAHKLDGALITVYLRPTAQNVDDITPITALVVDQVCDEDNELAFNVSELCKIIAPMEYEIGDANTNGRVQAVDATYINRTIANANGVTVTANNYLNYVPTYAEGDFVCSFEAMDVNEDGVLTSADSNFLLNYLAGTGPVGSLYEYTTVYYVIGTTAPAAA